MVIELQSSRLTGVIMLLMHLAALFILIWIEAALWVRLLLVLLVVASLINVFRRVVLRVADNAITGITLDSDGNMKLLYRSRHQSRVTGFHSLFVNPVITLLTVAVEGKLLPQNLVIPFDAIREDEKFRQLRVRLKSL